MEINDTADDLIKQIDQLACEIEEKKQILQASIDRTIESIKPYFTCSICKDLYTTPIIIDSGHTYCYSCIRQWFMISSICPLSGCNVSRSRIIPNRIIKSIMDYYGINSRETINVEESLNVLLESDDDDEYDEGEYDDEEDVFNFQSRLFQDLQRIYLPN